MKRTVYLLCFMFLGALLGFLAHAVIELVYSKFLVSDFDKYGFGLSWSAWFLIHNLVTGILVIIGLRMGYKWGRKWWQVLYVEQKYRKWLKRDLKQTF